MRIIGMDIHRVAAEVVLLLDGQLHRMGRIPMARDSLEAFARKELTHDDHGSWRPRETLQPLLRSWLLMSIVS